MAIFSQTTTVTLMNLRAIPQRLGASLVIVIGIAGVVAVLVSMLGMVTGLRHTMAGGARADRAIVLSKGATSPTISNLTREQVQIIMDAPGIKRDAAGKPLATALAFIMVDVVTKDGARVNTPMLGTGPEVFAVRSEIKLTGGRLFQPAVREMIAGKSAMEQFKGFEIGKTVVFRDSEWIIVGSFESGGDTMESYLIADADTVLSAFRRNTLQDVMVVLETPQTLDQFKAALEANPSLSVDVSRETDYLNRLANSGVSQILSFVAYTVGGIMAVGALFGALNAMYSTVSTRTAEIATLRAIGFRAGPVIISVFIEALTLALIGGVAGAAIAWVVFDGNSMSSNFGTSVQLESFLRIDGRLMVLGIIWAMAIGFIGGLFPAVRAARLPVATALQVR